MGFETIQVIKIPGYDHAGYYYLPDMDVYYDVNSRQFIYFDNGRWALVNELPPRYGWVDMRQCDNWKEKYYVVRDHPRQAEWERKHGHDNDNRRDGGHDNRPGRH